MVNESQVAKLIVKKLMNKLSPAENQALEGWMAISEECRQFVAEEMQQEKGHERNLEMAVLLDLWMKNPNAIRDKIGNIICRWPGGN